MPKFGAYDIYACVKMNRGEDRVHLLLVVNVYALQYM